MKKLSSQSSILLILSVSQLFGLSLWFATNAVLDQLKPEFNLNDSDLTLLSISVTMGFVLGGLTSSLFNLSDLMRATKFFFFS
ncbi:MAG: hypothetical protein IH840_01720 [Candidatus Heimdallarchaeota archaeon]|nr:hypothetical protein [Candidatus Heimdallarchaeota archaeon]